jgi:hypothetical protein
MRRAESRLREHKRLMDQYVAKGMSTSEASAKAFADVTLPKRKRPASP